MIELLDAIGKIAQYGVIGLVAALAIYGYLSERADNKALRDRLEGAAKASAATSAEQAVKFAEMVRAIQVATTDALKTLELAHREQEEELTVRLVETVRKHAEDTSRLTEKIAKLVESVQRRAR